jgi:uncharacterized BrkB/YihY/UPF0761 family membrane protein
VEPTPPRSGSEDLDAVETAPRNDEAPAEGSPSDATSRVSRARGRVHDEQARATRMVGDTRRRLEDARPRSTWVDVAFRAYEHDTSAGGAVIAGALAFRVFLFLVPYVFVVVVGIGYAANAADEDPGRLARDSGIGGLVAKAVSGSANLSGFERVTALTVGLVALFLGARALVKVLRLSYGMVWNVRPSKLKQPTRPALAIIAFASVGVVFAGTIGTLRHEGPIPAVIGFTLTTAVPFGMWLLASWYLPRRARTWQELIPGALLFAIGVQVLHIVTVVWIAHVLESKTDTYGAIGAALAILLWAYLLGRLITGAAVLDAALWLRRGAGASVDATTRDAQEPAVVDSMRDDVDPSGRGPQ